MKTIYGRIVFMLNKNTFVFDVDGTLAECRDEPIYEKNKLALQCLLESGKNVLIVSAGRAKRILNQLNSTGVLQGKISIMGNYGLDCIEVQNGEVVNESKVSYKSEIDEKFVNDLVMKFRKENGFEKFEGASHLINESGLVVIALLGTDATKEDKKNFDPDGKKRQMLVEKLEKILPSNMKAYVAGQASIDIIDSRFDKKNAIMLYAKQNFCTQDEILFFGDEITTPFGNDSSLLNSGIDYVEVKNYKEVSTFFENNFKNMADKNKKFA